MTSLQPYFRVKVYLLASDAFTAFNVFFYSVFNAFYGGIAGLMVSLRKKARRQIYKSPDGMGLVAFFSGSGLSGPLPAARLPDFTESPPSAPLPSA